MACSTQHSTAYITYINLYLLAYIGNILNVNEIHVYKIFCFNEMTNPTNQWSKANFANFLRKLYKIPLQTQIAMLHVNTLANLPAGIETVCVCVCACPCICKYIHTCIQIYIYMWIYVRIYCRYIYIYIYIYIYVCMYHYVTMGLSGFGRQKRPRNCQEIW